MGSGLTYIKIDLFIPMTITPFLLKSYMLADQL